MDHISTRDVANLTIDELRRLVRQARDERLNTKQAAQYIGVKPHTLCVWRSEKSQKLPYLKVGSKVYYRKIDLDFYLESRLVEV